MTLSLFSCHLNSTIRSSMWLFLEKELPFLLASGNGKKIKQSEKQNQPYSLGVYPISSSRVCQITDIIFFRLLITHILLPV